jgi:molybdate transport system substrate-binding protein
MNDQIVEIVTYRDRSRRTAPWWKYFNAPSTFIFMVRPAKSVVAPPSGATAEISRPAKTDNQTSWQHVERPPYLNLRTAQVSLGMGRMKARNMCLRAWMIGIVTILAFPSIASAQLRVITSRGFLAAYQELVPVFEKQTGIVVSTTEGASVGNGPNTIGALLRSGLTADLVIMSRAGLNQLIAEGRISVGSDVDLAKTPLGIAVRAGAAKPDFSSVESFKRMLLRAKSIAYQSSTTLYMTNKLLPQLGIANEVIRKSVEDGAPAVASGAAELVIAPVSELLHAPGVDYVGNLPPEIQFSPTFGAAILLDAKQVDAATRLIAFLSSEQARAAIRNSGMEPTH